MLAGALLCAGCATTPQLPGAKAEPPPVLNLQVDAPKALAALLRANLDLGQVNRLAAGEALQEGELDRLVAAAPEQARALLSTEGYYNAEVRVTRPDGTPPVVRVEVDPGPLTVVRAVDLQVEGPLADAARGGDPRARDVERSVHESWALKPGAAFRDDDWGKAKSGTLAQLRAQAYVEANWTRTQARVDAATQQADLSGTLASGPLYRTGELRIGGLEHQDAETVRNIADFAPGTPATETLLLDFQERLQRSALFDRAVVTLKPDAADPDATPVIVRVGERKLQEATVGLGYSANLGPRATLEHIHTRPFGYALTMRNRFEVARVQRRWDGEISTHTLPGLYRNLLGGTIERVESGTDVVTTASLRAGRAQETKRISRLAYLELGRSTTTSALGRERTDSLAAHYHGIWRKVDDQLLPTTGHVWTGQFGVGLARSDPGSSGPFTRLYARLDAFHPFGAQWYGQGRIELGQVNARAGVVVPDALRFRAGGDNSVRGYAYRSLTPKVNGIDVGGKVLFTASAEVAHPLFDRLPQLWGAVFVDAGNAADAWNDLRPVVGVGAGVRFRSPVGPLKLDLAYGVDDRRFRLHLSVGVSF